MQHRWNLKLRWHLLILVLLTLLPMVTLALGLIYWNAQIQRKYVEESMLQTIHAVTYALDQELQASAAALQSLAFLDSPAQSGQRQFEDQARAMGANHQNWSAILRTSDDGKSVWFIWPGKRALNPGQPVAVTTEGKAKQLAVSNFLRKEVFGAPAALVYVPVPDHANDKSRGTIGALIQSTYWTRFLQSRAIPPGWVAGIIDRQGIVIARSRGAEQFVGKPAPGWVREGIVKYSEGKLEGPAFEGNHSLWYSAVRLQAAGQWHLQHPLPCSRNLCMKQRGSHSEQDFSLLPSQADLRCSTRAESREPSASLPAVLPKPGPPAYIRHTSRHRYMKSTCFMTLS